MPSPPQTGIAGFKPVLVPLLIGLLLRLAWAWLVPVVPVSDSAMYWHFALSLAQGDGYAFPDGRLTAYWPVGTSAIHGLMIHLFGAHLSLVVLLNLLWAAWLTALWPMQVMFATIISSEMVFNACLMLGLVAWGASHRPTVGRTLVFAAAMVAASYVRPTALPLLFTIPVFAFLVQRDWRATARQLVIIGVVAASLFAPWMARNKAVVGAAVPVSTNFGPNLWMGNNPDTNGGYMPLPDKAFANEAARDQYYKQQAVDYIKAQPTAFAMNCWRRLVMTFDRESISVQWNAEGIKQVLGERALTPLKVLCLAYWWAMLLAGVAGLLMLLGRWKAILAHHHIWQPVLLFAVVPVLTVGQDRYHVPLNPFLAVGAAALGLALVRRWRTTA